MAYVNNCISNYNTTNNYYNYYIGTTDSSGDVRSVYDPDIFNEQTMVFTEPVTGEQYQTTGWVYAYDSGIRGYSLDLAAGTYNYNGTDIRTICLFYLDDELLIVGLPLDYVTYYSAYSTSDEFLSNATFVDSYSYVIAQHGDVECEHSYTSETVTPPTCTAQGVRRYTCQLCGHTRDEKIPALGHNWEITEEVETVLNDNGDVVSVGYTLYTCSGCGETYKQWDDTGQPGPPGGNDDDGSGSDSGTSLFTRIKNAVADAIGSLVESVLSFVTTVLNSVLGLAEDLLSFFVDFLSGTVLSGISDFFGAFSDVSLWSFFTREKDDGSTEVSLPEGVAAVFAFFSGVILAMPAEIKSLFIFGVAALVLIAVFKLVKS